MLVAIEGPDGIGKSSQAKELCRRLIDLGIPTGSMHFPVYEDAPFGETIAAYLRGEMGSLESQDPRLVGLLYACDFRAHQERLIEAKNDPTCVFVLDRYYHSNFVYQAAKAKTHEAMEELIRWLGLVNEAFGLISADLTFILTGSLLFIDKNIFFRHDERDNRDIHEADRAFVSKTQEIYEKITGPDIVHIHCTDGAEIRSLDSIADSIFNRVKTEFSLRGTFASNQLFPF